MGAMKDEAGVVRRNSVHASTGRGTLQSGISELQEQFRKELTQERVDEIARMLGGQDMTEATFVHAIEMIARGQHSAPRDTTHGLITELELAQVSLNSKINLTVIHSPTALKS